MSTHGRRRRPGTRPVRPVESAAGFVCAHCGLLRANRIAGDDNELILVSLAVRALARPAFPLETVVGALESPPGDSAAYPGPRVERE